MKTTIEKEIKQNADKETAQILSRFFKTAKGQYGQGDIFLGLKVPLTRKIVKKHGPQTLLKDAEALLKSKYHECRLAALLILVEKHKKGDPKAVDIYLKNTQWVNNWDLVDLSSHYILGSHLQDKDRTILYQLARSDNLWERRIAIISTFWFIKNHDFKDALQLSEILLHDAHDLIHKAVGWMLREIGKRNLPAEENFLAQHAPHMPRTMLRYAVEKFPEKKRKHYMNMKSRVGL